MKTKNLNKRLSIWAAFVAAILLIPLVTRAPWSLGDFILAGAVLFGAAAGYELLTKNMPNKMHRAIIAICAIGGVIFIWAMAVSGP